MKPWPESLREAAGLRVEELGLPDQKDDAWRLIDLSVLYDRGKGLSVASVSPTAVAIDAQVIVESYRLVFVDGCFSETLSNLSQDDMVKIAPLGLEDGTLHAYFGKNFQEQAFAQINTRDFTDCAWIHVKGETQKPIHVLHVTTGASVPCYMRCLVVLEPHAQAHLIEEYMGEESCFVNVVSEIVIGDLAKLRHVRVQSESMQSVHVGNTAVHLGRSGQYDATSLSFGAKWSRHFLHVVYQGEDAQVQLDGLILTEGCQISDEHTRIEHRVPRCRSVQRHKCIAGGVSTAVFSGNIVVHSGAVGTDTRQESRNLLLSGLAKVDAQPQLEILNNDVSCKHGATVGQIDSESLFYLRSRGVDEVMARKSLIYAFAAEIVDRIPIPVLVERLRASMLGRLV